MSRKDRADSPDTSSDPDTSIDSGQFDGASVDRRTFLSLAAATGAALSLPGTGTAQVEEDVLTDRAQFVVNHTPDSYRAPLAVEFENQQAADNFGNTFEFSEEDRRGPVGDDIVRPEKTVTRDDPTPAGHGLLTASEVETLVDMDGVERVDFSPGANPFWTLDEEPYMDRVFPGVEESRNYLDYEETVAGLGHLESEFPDMLNVETTSRPSAGWNNLFLEENERYPIYAAQVTNNVNDEQSFQEKNKVVYTVSIHGDEPQGRETGSRLLEDVLRGEAEDGVLQALDDVVLVFLYINPDGWMSRQPMTELENEPDDSLEFDDVSFLRGNSSYIDTQRGPSQIDTNRQYPTIGWTNPGFYPAEPEGAPSFFEDLVPDALGAVEYFRGFENVEFLCDYHGMGLADHMIYHLETNAPFDHRRTHDLDEVSIRSGQFMVDEWGSFSTIEDDAATAVAEHYNVELDVAYENLPDGDQFNGLLDYGSIYDMLNYQVTGAFLGWAGVPEEQGGLGAITVAPEMLHSNPSGNTFLNWKPYWSRHQTTAFRASMVEYAKLAAADTEATVETDGVQTAVVESDTLTRSSADLPHTGDSTSVQSASGTAVRRSSDQLGTASSGSQIEMQSHDETSSLYVNFQNHDLDSGTLRLRDPNGKVVRRVDFGEMPANADFLDNLHVSKPATGSWSVDVSGGGALEIELLMLDADEHIPDPRTAWDGEGFEQNEYEVNPMQFFEDLEPFIEDNGTFETVSVSEVAGGALDGYDQVVISHDSGLDDDTYVTALESFIEDGGDVVLTDSGVHVLGDVNVGDLSKIGPDNVRDVEINFVLLDERRFNHPLLEGIEPGQQEVWKGPQVGYTTGTDQPATVVDGPVFARAGGAIAGRIEGDDSAFGVEPGEEINGEPGVGAGTFSVGDAEINVISSILPPANQEVLHPFGMADYSLTFMGHTILHNALGFIQHRIVDGDVIRSFGGGTIPTVETYQNDSGVIDTDGVREALGDWRANIIETDTLRDVVTAWRTS